jgi:magnesium transporter
VSDEAGWVDLLDPTRDEIARAAPVALLAPALDELAAPMHAGRPARPVFESHGPYIFGRFLVPVVVAAEDRLFYQEIDLVLTGDAALTVRKTPPGDDLPLDSETVGSICGPHADAPGALAHGLVEEVAERFLDLVDAIDEEINELEDGIERWPPERVRARISELRQQILRVRQTFAPTRDAVRRVVDGRLAIDGADPFTTELRVRFGDAYDKLLRASEGLDVSRELLASARDYHQAKIAETQNDVVKTLTVIASLLLAPTFIVGLYGQNFAHMPELAWHLGYAWSWLLIGATTVLQLALYRWKRWI